MVMVEVGFRVSLGLDCSHGSGRVANLDIRFWVVVNARRGKLGRL